MEKVFSWTAMHYNINADKIEPYEVLKHRESSIRDVVKKSDGDRKKVSDFLKREFLHQYWSRCEYELILTRINDRLYLYPWVGCRNPEGVRVEVTDDPNFDWAGFYVWITSKKFESAGEIKIDIYDQLIARWDELIDLVLEYFQ
jgi:hypothetical protein